MPKHTVAIDYDATITLDVPTWRTIIATFRANHWVPIIITARRHTLENAKAIQNDVGFLPIIYTDSKPKRQYALDKGY